MHYKLSHTPQQYLYISIQYRYELVIQNSLCDDFVDEKIYEALLHGTIPIYLGARNIREFLPGVRVNGTLYPMFIDVHALGGAKGVAAHIRELEADNDKYMAYHVWRWTGTGAAVGDRESSQQRETPTSVPSAAALNLDGRRDEGQGRTPRALPEFWPEMFPSGYGRDCFLCKSVLRARMSDWKHQYRVSPDNSCCWKGAKCMGCDGPEAEAACQRGS
jgi:hypothetical protein